MTRPLVSAIVSNAYRTIGRHLQPVKRAARRAYVSVFGEMSDYLRDCKGIIHVGANEGQERELYARHQLRVVWIEPIPEVYQKLQENIAGFPAQMAINALITDRDGEQRVLHVANNSGASSSILDLHQHRDIWPDIRYVRDLQLTTSMLPTALARAGVDPADYDALLLDTQGSELLVLNGAKSILPLFKYVQAEAADFESYRGGTTVQQIVDFMTQQGFRLVRKEPPFALRVSGGTYYELLFKAWPSRAS